MSKKVYIILVESIIPGMYEPARLNKDGSLTMALGSITSFPSRRDAQKAVAVDIDRLAQKRFDYLVPVHRDYKIKSVRLP